MIADDGPGAGLKTGSNLTLALARVVAVPDFRLIGRQEPGAILLAMRRVLIAALGLFLAAALLGCSSSAPPPSSYEEVEVGVPYRVEVYFSADFEMGGSWWRFENFNYPPPMPAMPFGVVSQPYAIPGVVTLTSPDAATFRADSNGAEMQPTTTDEHVEAGCI